MHILFLDETNVEHTKINNFFIYGGVFFPADACLALHTQIKDIRSKAGYKEDDLFKFDTHSCPTEVSKENFNAAKENMLRCCIENKVSFIVYLVHHNIAHQSSLERKIQWASCEIIHEFNSYLAEAKDCGIVIFDKLPFKGEFKYINNLFRKGITTATSQSPHIPSNIIGYNMSSAGASHLNSVTDIVLGAFRYCVNAPEESATAKILFPNVLTLLYGRIGQDGKKYIKNYGLLIRPHRNLLYENEYKALLKKLHQFLS